MKKEFLLTPLAVLADVLSIISFLTSMRLSMSPILFIAVIVINMLAIISMFFTLYNTKKGLAATEQKLRDLEYRRNTPLSDQGSN